MTTPPPNSPVGSSRLLGTHDAQRAVDSLTKQVQNLERSVANAARAFQSLANGTNRANTRTTGATNWNINSNFPNNNGGARGGNNQVLFTNTGTLNGLSANGGGWRNAATIMMGSGRGNGNAGGIGGIGVTAAMGRMGVAGALTAGVARGLVNYGNRNMSSNMQMDMFGNYAALLGGFSTGGYQAANNVAMRTTFANNSIALSANDAARGGYMAAYTFGAPQFNGRVNSAYTQGVRQASGFAFASPTAGFSGAMTAAQQFYAPRSFYALQAFGVQSPIGPGGRQAPMSSVAGSIMQRLYGTQSVSQRSLAAGFQQGGYAGASLQNIGRQAGWSQQTIQMVENYMVARNAALNKGMTPEEFDKLTQQASSGSGASKRNALARLKETTGMGASMFERQRDLNATRLTRQERILESLAPAFEKATDAVNRFSQALTSVLTHTPLGGLIGTLSGGLTPFSNAMGGFGSLLGGVGGGLLAAAMLRGGGGLLGGLGGLFGRGAGAAGTGGLINATRGAGGVYNITSLGARSALTRGAMLRGGAYGLAGYATSTVGHGLTKNIKNTTGRKWANVGVDAATGAAYGAAAGSFIPVIGTGAGATAGALIGGGIGIARNFLGGDDTNVMTRMMGTDGIAGGASDGKSSPSGGTNAIGTNTGASAAEVISYARQQLGDPYVWGGVGPDGWDCSGLIQWSYRKAGVKLPRTSQMMQKVGKEVSVDKVQPGDLLFNGRPAHHVAMALGGGKLIEAPRTGLNVRIRNFKPGEFTNARRILGSIGSMGDIAAENGKTTTQNDMNSRIGGDIGGVYGGTSELAAIMSALSGGSGAGQFGLAASATGSTSISDSSSSSVTGKKAPGSPKGNQAIGKHLAESMYGWKGDQWKALYNLWMRESNWDESADNPTSDAYGIPQALPGSKMRSAGSDWKTNPTTQIKWGLRYIKERYGSPAKAWSFWNSKNPHWYAEGAWELDQDTTARVHKGEMILPAKQAESVRSAITNTLTTGSTASGGGIVFHPGSIVVNPPVGMTATEAKTTAKMIVDAITEDKRIKEIQRGY